MISLWWHPAIGKFTLMPLSLATHDRLMLSLIGGPEQLLKKQTRTSLTGLSPSQTAGMSGQILGHFYFLGVSSSILFWNIQRLIRVHKCQVTLVCFMHLHLPSEWAQKYMYLYLGHIFTSPFVWLWIRLEILPSCSCSYVSRGKVLGDGVLTWLIKR